MLALVVVEGVAVALLGLLVAGLLRSHAEILRALHELGAGLDPADRARASGTAVTISGRRPAEAGATAHDVAGVTLDDEVAALAIVGSAQDTLLAFLSSGCATCAGFWEALRGHPTTVPGGARLLIVTKDPDEESQRRLRELAPDDVTLVMSSAAWTSYEVPVAPYFVYVDGVAGRVVGEGAAGSWPQVQSLMRQAIADAGARSAHPPEGTRPRQGSDRERAARVDEELLAAGIGPGHPSLYAGPDRADSDERT